MQPVTRLWLYLLLAGALLYASSTMVSPINATRKKSHLVLPPAPDDTAMSMLYTPLLAIGRAPLVDVLWIRATQLKEEGRVFDALQLAKTICKLQPKFPAVWAFQAWNMSYNISVTFDTPEQRWRWVRNGYELLRDQGIPLNPNNTQLYRELSWILFHKVGDFMDDWHLYYKNEFAKLNEKVLGEPPPGFVRPGRVRGDFYREYDYPPLALMPERFDQLLGDGPVPVLVDQYRKTSLSPAEVLEALAMKKGEIDKHVASMNRTGVMSTDVETLVDLLKVDLKPCKAAIESLRVAADSRREARGVVALLKNDPDAAAFVQAIDGYGFDVRRPGVFMGLMNALRTQKITMPDVPEKLQDQKGREFLKFFGDINNRNPRAALERVWRNEVGFDIEPVKQAQREMAAGLDDFVSKLRGFGFDASEPGVYLGLLDAIRDDELKLPGVATHEQADEKHRFMEVWNAPKYEHDRKILEWFWRAYGLRHEFKLEPLRLVTMDNGFGMIMDYRLAESHSLYWANLGTDVGTDKREPVDIHRLNTDRVEFYCLQKMFQRGRLVMSPDAKMGEPPMLTPDLRAIPPLVEAFFRESKEYLKTEKNVEGRHFSINFETGFVGFMRAAALAYHEYGYNDEAKKLFEILRREKPDSMYEQGFDEFIKKQTVADREIGDYRIMQRRIAGLLRRSLINLAYDEDELAEQFVLRAKELYKYYQDNVASKRLKIEFTFEEVYREVLNSMPYFWNRRETYLRVCRKLGIEPIPETERVNPDPLSVEDDGSGE